MNTNKYKIVKYFKANKYSIVDGYESEEKANEVCDYMNNEVKKISKLICFKVEKYG